MTIASVTEAIKHPNWIFSLSDSSKLIPYLNEPLVTRRQDLNKAYVLNGALYWVNAKWLNQHKTLITDETLAYVMPNERSIDIDTPMDWEWAEFSLSPLE